MPTRADAARRFDCAELLAPRRGEHGRRAQLQLLALALHRREARRALGACVVALFCERHRARVTSGARLARGGDVRRLRVLERGDARRARHRSGCGGVRRRRLVCAHLLRRCKALAKRHNRCFGRGCLCSAARREGRLCDPRLASCALALRSSGALGEACAHQLFLQSDELVEVVGKVRLRHARALRESDNVSDPLCLVKERVIVAVGVEKELAPRVVVED